MYVSNINFHLSTDSLEQIREIIEVFESRDQIASTGYLSMAPSKQTLCLSENDYNILLFIIIVLICSMGFSMLAAACWYR